MKKSNKFYQSAAFKAQQKEWYAKLRKQTDFVDIEKLVGDEMMLKQLASNIYKRSSEQQQQAKVAYYEKLGEYVHKEKFDSDADYVTLSRRSEGFTLKKIGKELKDLGYKYGDKTIIYTIRKYEHRWGIRSWKPEQMTQQRYSKKK